MQGQHGFSFETQMVRSDQQGAPYLTNIFNDELFGLNVLFGKQAPSVHPTAPKPQVLGPPLHVLRGVNTQVALHIWNIFLAQQHGDASKLTVHFVP